MNNDFYNPQDMESPDLSSDTKFEPSQLAAKQSEDESLHEESTKLDQHTDEKFNIDDENLDEADNSNQKETQKKDIKDPPKIEDDKMEEEIPDAEKNNRKIFILGGIAFAAILFATFAIAYFIVTSAPK